MKVGSKPTRVCQSEGGVLTVRLSLTVSK